MAIKILGKGDSVRVRTPEGTKLVMMADIERMVMQKEQVAPKGEAVFDEDVMAATTDLDGLPPKEKLAALQALDEGALVSAGIFQPYLVKKTRK